MLADFFASPQNKNNKIQKLVAPVKVVVQVATQIYLMFYRFCNLFADEKFEHQIELELIVASRAINTPALGIFQLLHL